MYKVMMIVNGEHYEYGSYENRDRANEIAMSVANDRQIKTYVTDTENILPKELQEAIDKCKIAQQNKKKRQQQYCINKYYEKKQKHEDKD